MIDFPVLGYCPKCKESLISQNGNATCLNCVPVKRNGPQRIAKYDDPGEKAMRDILRDSGIKNPIRNVSQVAKKTGSVQEALVIMQSLSMPDDIKQFKKIKKIIKQLEDLVGEKHAL